MDEQFDEFSGRSLWNVGGSSSVRKCSEEGQSIRCDPCLTDMNYVEAEKYCKDCNQYLCTNCIRYHRKFTSTMRHILLYKNTMLQSQTDDVYDYANPTEPTNVESAHVEQPSASKHSRYENTALAHVGDINVKTSRDMHDCNITGCELLTADFLVLADNHNKAIKLLDTKHEKIATEYTMSSAPWDVAVVEEDLFGPEQLAVTLPDEQRIQFLILSYGELTESKSFKVDGDCRGIAYSHNRLVVTCDAPIPCKVEILDMDGHIIKTLNRTEHGIDLFKCPQNIAVGHDGVFIYVTDRVTCNVTKISFDGKVIATYDDRELCSPEGLVITSDGTAIVCNYRNNMLHLVSAECEKIKILKPLTDDVICPTAVCYCEERNRLYVSRYWVGAHPLYLNNIKIFQFELLSKSS